MSFLLFHLLFTPTEKEILHRLRSLMLLTISISLPFNQWAFSQTNAKMFDKIIFCFSVTLPSPFSSSIPGQLPVLSGPQEGLCMNKDLHTVTVTNQTSTIQTSMSHRSIKIIYFFLSQNPLNEIEDNLK